MKLFLNKTLLLSVQIFVLFFSCRAIQHDYKKIDGIVVYEVINNCEINIYFLKNNCYYIIDDSDFRRKKNKQLDSTLNKDNDLDCINEVNLRKGVDPFSFIGNNNVYIDNTSQNKKYIVFKIIGVALIDKISNEKQNLLFKHYHYKGKLKIEKIISTHNFNSKESFILSKTEKKQINIYPCSENFEVW